MNMIIELLMNCHTQKASNNKYFATIHCFIFCLMQLWQLFWTNLYWLVKVLYQVAFAERWVSIKKGDLAHEAPVNAGFEEDQHTQHYTQNQVTSNSMLQRINLGMAPSSLTMAQSSNLGMTRLKKDFCF